MNTKSNICNVKKSVAALKAAYFQGSLKGHPFHAAIAIKGREVLASWGTAMRV